MNEFEFRVRRYQRAFHEALVQRTHDRLIAIWHRRAGKDEIVLNAMRELAWKDPGTYWHCFPEQKQARKAICSASRLPPSLKWKYRPHWLNWSALIPMI